jgi:hypothetical protein
MSSGPGTPSNAQCLWLTSRFQPIRNLFQQFDNCSTPDELKVVLNCVQHELGNVCVQFASLAWAQSRDVPELVPTCGPLPGLTSTCDVSERPSLSTESDLNELDESLWKEVVYRKSQLTTKPSPKLVSQPVYKRTCARATKPRQKNTNLKMFKNGRHNSKALSLTAMSKVEYKRRFGTKQLGKKKKTTNFVRIVSHKDLVQYLADHHFILTSDSRTSDWRYERQVCGCGHCPIFQPVRTCDTQRQIASIAHPGSNTKKNYYRNKRMDVDKLTEHACAEYAAIV